MATQKNKIQITLSVDDKGTATIDKFSGNYEQSMNKLKSSTVAASNKMGGALQGLRSHWLAITAVLAGAGYGLKKLTESFLDASKTTENLRVRLKVLTGSVEEGNRLFSLMADYAGKVPFEYEKIMGAATQLGGIFQGNVNKVNEWMPLIGDLAAATGMGIQQVTEQVSRMYSAGAASADMFRERGVLAMLGFKAGVSYTAEETRKTLMNAWTKTGSMFRGATADLAKTWEGTMSMFSDKWFKFRNLVMDSGIFNAVKEALQGVLEYINKLDEEGKLDEWAQRTAQAIIDMAIASLKAIQKIKNYMISALNWIEEKEYLVKYGLVGYFIGGRRGLVAGVAAALGGDILKSVQENLTNATDFAKDKLIGFWDWLSNKEKPFVFKVDDEVITAEFGKAGEEGGKSFIEKANDVIDPGLQKTIDMLEGLKPKLVKASSKAGALAGKSLADGISDGMDITVTSKFTDEMKDFLKEIKSANEDVSDRLNELATDEYDHKIYLLDKWIEEKKKILGEDERLTEIHNLALAKIEEERAEDAKKAQEKAQEGLIEQQKEMAELMRDNLKDLFLDSSENDFDDWFKRIGDKLKNWVADISTSMAVNTVGKFFGQEELISGMPNFQDFIGGIGSLFKKKQPQAPEGGYYDYTNNVSVPASEGPNAGGVVSGVAGAATSGAIAGAAGGATAAIGGVGAVIGLGMSVYSYTQSQKMDREAMRRARGEQFTKELEQWMNKEFDSLEDMIIGAGEDLFSSKALHDAIQFGELVVSEWAYHWQKALKLVREETSLTGKTTAENMRLLGRTIKQVADTSPAMRKEFEAMKEKMDAAFSKGVLEDFTNGALTAQEAVEKMMSTGIDQLAAQTELFGENYNNLIIAVDGSIETFGETEKAFNDMRASLDDLEETVNDLPDSLGETKKALQNLTLVAQSIIDIMQSATETMESLVELPENIKAFNEAIAEGDWESAVKALEKMEDTLLQLSSTFSELAYLEDPFGGMNYLGQYSQALIALYAVLELFVKLPLTIMSNWDELARHFRGVQAQVTQAVADMITALKTFFQLSDTSTPNLDKWIAYFNDLAYEEDELLDKWHAWEEEIENSDIPDLIDDVLAKFNDMTDVIDEATKGTVTFGLDKMLEEFAYYMLEVQELVDKGAITQSQYETMTTTAIQSYTQQIEDYFEAILKGFNDLSKIIDRDIQNVLGSRDSTKIIEDMVEIGIAMGATDIAKDPAKWLDYAGQMKDLILEKYQIEAQAIQEQISELQRLRDVFDGVAEAARNQLLDIQTSGLNPETAEERLSYLDTEANRLRGLVSTSTGEEQAQYQQQLMNVLGEQLQMAEEVYQRPSPEYQALYTSITDELKNIQTLAEKQAETYDEQIVGLENELVNLQTETVGWLSTLDEKVGLAKSTLEGIKTDSLSALTGDISALKEYFSPTSDMREHIQATATNTGLMKDIMDRRFPLASWWTRNFGGFPAANGIENVPYDNFPARLHKGEQVIPANQRGQNITVSVPVTVTVNGGGKDIIQQVKDEIKWGSVGTLIEEKVRKIA